MAVATQERAEAIASLARLRKENKLYRFKPYPWQIDFFAEGAVYSDRMLIAGNRVGKTHSAGFEVACHLTGLYPEWWTGKRYKTPVLVWCGGITNESLRDISQKELLGGAGEDFGTGWIPKEKLGKPNMRMAGIANVVESVKVRHVSGAQSECVWKSYEQGWQKWQGTAVDIIWLDEDPDDVKLFTEALTRLITKRGQMLVTFTPLLGVTPMLQHFYDLGDRVFIKNVTWDDAPHLTDKDKEEMLMKYPEHERETRSKGIPMRGEGVVFAIPEADIKCDAFEIPRHWSEIIGIDFGWDHPSATAKIAYDRDADIIYVVAAEKKSKRDALQHSEAIKGMGGGINGGIPVAWPHDGGQHEKGKGVQLVDTYRKHDLNLLSQSARYKNDIGGGQSVEKSVMEILERAKTGRFKVFSHLSGFFEEWRNYHRKDGKIVDKTDDIIKAVFYAYMMRRYAVSKYMRESAGGSSGAPDVSYL